MSTPKIHYVYCLLLIYMGNKKPLYLTSSQQARSVGLAGPPPGGAFCSSAVVVVNTVAIAATARGEWGGGAGLLYYV